MDWIIGMQNAIDYIENNLTETIDYEIVAAQSFSSCYHFQRVFSILCGFTIGEYIRNRRLSLAGTELAASDAKVMDVALKYGYESPDSFAKAFQKFHGMLPSQARNNGSNLKSFSRLVLKFSLEGGTVTMFLSAFVHLMISCAIILLLAPILFEAALPVQLPFFFLALAIYIIVSLSIGSILGLVVKNQAKLTMIAQLVFLPSIMLSGIMFPIDLLPNFLEAIGRIFPASWGYRLMLDNSFCLENLWYLILVFCVAVIICAILLNKQKSK